MTHPGYTEGGRASAERFKASPFNKPLKSPRDSAKANQKALRKMSLLELHCGITPEQFDAWQADQRAKVRARFGKAA